MEGLHALSRGGGAWRTGNSISDWAGAGRAVVGGVGCGADAEHAVSMQAQADAAWRYWWRQGSFGLLDGATRRRKKEKRIRGG